MNRSLKIYLGLLVLILIGITYLESNRPKPIDWRPYYTPDKKTPYGLYVWSREMDSLVGKDRIEKVHNTAFEFFDPAYDTSGEVNYYNRKGTILAIDHHSRFDESSLAEILYFISHGNEALISMQSLPQIFLDSLHITVNDKVFLTDTHLMRMVHYDEVFTFDETHQLSYFDSIDTTDRIVNRLGYFLHEKDTFWNLIRLPYYNGYIYLHTFPAAFTNYHLLQNPRQEYIEQLVTYLQDKHPIYLLDNRTKRSESQSENPLRFILTNPALKWAWYMFLIGSVLFMIFRAKRQQRIVPIIEPLANTSVEFVKTISSLYFQENDFLNIYEKKIQYFLERVRSDYYLDTQVINDDFARRLTLKSGKPAELVDRILKHMRNKKKYRYASEVDLQELSRDLDIFWNKNSTPINPLSK